ncbi:factor-independent urate hydroxylase [Amycolatopsis japonica]|uniref:Uricase n=2 Tax=Amycolatopsis keratiniphila TaxID=129921 RepID=R4SYW2_9PSEU|nr:urate oxidase [Amycolatopsis keratiniphila]AGM08529.1 urate oxidase [Amycolatopsis keratiniphila]OLZ44023.1 urate oxidase [Amycolatopsis keratiniphila subsp. nogabecina]ONF72379.1 urate oxidase [Amycolatopsis keratiniphila subsp. keratiniphila]SDU70713.1 urate oxidase [Amycolatopsis keratiniphila]
MAITLGPNQYGKAEVRLVTVQREGTVHHLKDLTVSTSLRGDLAATHLTGDNADVVATDTQKNTVYAFAKEAPVGEIEDFALRLGRHFVGSFEHITGARILIDEHGWNRISGHDHAFSQAGSEKRTTAVTVQGDQAWVVSGLDDLVVLKSTGSEFHGFPRDEYTTLAETNDRILATAVTARWRYQGDGIDWATSHAEVRRIMLETFADKHSLSLQQTLYAMGEAVLKEREEVAEVRLSLPNKHHFLVDLSPFGLKNDNEVFYAADRPYGLIEGVVLRDDAEDAGLAWHTLAAF